MTSGDHYIVTCISWCLWLWHGWSYGFVHNLCSQEPYGSIRNTSAQWKVYLIMHVTQITTDDVIMTTASCIISHKIYMLFYCALFCCGYSYSEISCAHTIFICNYLGSYHLISFVKPITWYWYFLKRNFDSSVWNHVTYFGHIRQIIFTSIRAVTFKDMGK